MGYLPKYDYDIFISYAHVDNQPLVRDGEGWVDEFHRSFRAKLGQQIGRHDRISIWWDRRLPGNEILQPSILSACRKSGILLCITSPGYMASDWCLEEYEAFCSANAGRPPRYGTSSRVFNIRLGQIASNSPTRTKYAEMFNQSLGYRFANPDSDLALWPSDSDRGYWIRLGDLARDAVAILEAMRSTATKDSEQTGQFVLNVNANSRDFRYPEAEKLVARLKLEYGDPRIELVRLVRDADFIKLVLEAPRSTCLRLSEIRHLSRGDSGLGMEPEVGVPSGYPGNLDAILLQATKRLVISGHTINRFSHDERIREALKSVLANGVQVTLIMLNPRSKYAQAHAPYHQMESGGASGDQHKRALDFLAGLFQSLDASSRCRLEVLLSNYMPRFRVVVVDDKQLYLYLYMYGEDVSDYPDFVLEGEESRELVSGMFTRILTSTQSLTRAPEMIPFIRYGRIYEYWEASKLAEWDGWNPEVRYRHRMIHRYYVEHAGDFDRKFGDLLERYVKEHLDRLSGRSIVLGCGSGKEVEHLTKRGRCGEVLGVDFSPGAIALAKSRYEPLADRFMVADFYDLEYLDKGEFDSVVANAAFAHLFERDDMAVMLEKIMRKLKPEGLCFIRNLYKEIDSRPVEEEYHQSDERLDDLRWFIYYSRSRLAELAHEVGFVVDDGATREIARSCGYGNAGIVLTKGFPHMKHSGVFWPTILLKKPTRQRPKRRRPAPAPSLPASLPPPAERGK